MFKKVRQYFNLGQQVTFWDSEGHVQHGIVESPVRRISGTDCVMVDGGWLSLNCISIDGQIAEINRERVGRMVKHTGGYFGTWIIDRNCFGITDWSYEAPSFNRYYRSNGGRQEFAVCVNPRPRHYLYRVYNSDGTLYAEDTLWNSLNEVGQITCDVLRECLVQSIG